MDLSWPFHGSNLDVLSCLPGFFRRLSVPPNGEWIGTKGMKSSDGDDRCVTCVGGGPS